MDVLRNIGRLLQGFISALLKFCSTVGCAVGCGLLAWGVLVSVGSFLQSPLGIKADFEEPYMAFGLAALFASGVIGFIAWAAKPRPDNG